MYLFCPFRDPFSDTVIVLGSFLDKNKGVIEQWATKAIDYQAYLLGSYIIRTVTISIMIRDESKLDLEPEDDPSDFKDLLDIEDVFLPFLDVDGRNEIEFGTSSEDN